MTFKVVFHIDELSKWGKVMANVNNMLKGLNDLEEEAEIVVIANGEAVKGYLSEDQQPALQNLCDQGIIFNICQNSMRGFEIDASTLPSLVTIVPAAVIALAQRQHAGFAYIKP